MLNALQVAVWRHGIVGVVGGACVLFASAQVSLPWHPVPLSLQTFVIFLIGLSYTPHRALGSVGSWLWLAALGAPVLAGYSGGLIVLFGPTGGYLIGMALAAYAMAWLRSALNVNSFIGYVALSFLGSVIIFVSGHMWLASFVGARAAFEVGVIPFLGGDVVKVLLASGLVKFYQERSFR